MITENQLTFKFDTRYLRFPEEPKKINIGGFEFYDYISPQAMNAIIQNFSDHINLRMFDEVLVNQSGGDHFAKNLAYLQKYDRKIIDINYARGGKIKTPVPDHLRDKKIAIIEDILDGGGTAQRMVEDAPNATILFMTQKINVPNQMPIDHKLVALLIDNVWVGGFGMNIDDEGDSLPKDFLRDYPGLAAKIIKNR
ncbi:MAG TPA: hypothetical protein VKC53_01110 [Patescibacteria group bacterium]|nr:hypothetical protein [Patescibacteria group bacterium]